MLRNLILARFLFPSNFSGARAMTMASGYCKYSCENETQTLEWIKAIVDFIEPFSFLMNARVVNFFEDRLWEYVDEDWMDCLSNELVENLLLIPSGVVQEHWPASLKEFVRTSRSLALPREQANLQTVLQDLHMTSLDSVLSQGMNLKKKHEVEILSAVVSSIMNNSGAHTVVDVGAGQGYLAQVLSFQYKHSVVAVDACSHHGSVTDARAARIRKYYAAQMRKSGSRSNTLDMPKTITCNVLSTDTLRAVTIDSLHKNNRETKSTERVNQRCSQSFQNPNCVASLVLAGLHACGDLSVTMLRTFLQCKEVKAVVSIGCCYNLLSEEGPGNLNSLCGFPLSFGVKSTGLSLGKTCRDLACQSAERWSSLGRDAGLQNFELHAFRAGFQMVLSKYYPEILITSPSVGRQGKALRRKKQRSILECHKSYVESIDSSQAKKQSTNETISSIHEPTAAKTDGCSQLDVGDLQHGTCFNRKDRSESDKHSFEEYCRAALSRLGLKPLRSSDFQNIWKETETFRELIGPYWSLRAAMGPILESLILLDRLLFLQEQGSSIEAVMLPIFNPALSPRNVAIIAKRVDKS